ncbi:uncharacterized protein LOC111700011 [Eurytemora carolleeae]|uniref:uncharacterized protein LOC111700011 n=1 Tax=Eurytemora carolleeae TaxID=1294199 RepID=UPI000C78BA48|nr:uncharacterized protein LOC111700011 [Eurytemora carolleeae]|eukprot:XP_023326585.1 uncharacterized protein LOC111700011 [Eurytemora affinis]
MRNSTSLAHVGVLLDLPDGLLDVSEELDYDEDDGEGDDGVLDNLRILRVLGDGSIQHQEETNQNIILTNDTDAWHLSLLVISSINVCLVLLYWIYILFISYTRSTRWKPPLLPHILLLGLLLAASAGFPNLHTESIFYCQPRLKTPT